MACIFVDVDGTMTDAHGHANGMPRADVVAELRRAFASGREVVVWSARGAEYAERWCRRHVYGTSAADPWDIYGLKFISKPDFIVDDWACENKPRIRPDDKLTILSPEEFAEGSWRKR